VHAHARERRSLIDIDRGEVHKIGIVAPIHGNGRINLRVRERKFGKRVDAGGTHSGKIERDTGRLQSEPVETSFNVSVGVGCPVRPQRDAPIHDDVDNPHRIARNNERVWRQQQRTLIIHAKRDDHLIRLCVAEGANQ